MMTRPKQAATPTWPRAWLCASTTIAPQPAGPGAEDPRSAASAGRQRGGLSMLSGVSLEQLHEVADAARQLGGGRPEAAALGRHLAGGSRGIGHAPVAKPRVPRKGRAGFASAVAHRHDAVEMDALELAEFFRALGLDVDAALRHGCDCQRMNGLGRLGAGAPGLDAGAAQVTEKALR